MCLIKKNVVSQPKHVVGTIQYNTKFIYIVGDTNSITLAIYQLKSTQ